MKNLIITASDEKYGNFLISHWLKSLKENVNLKNIEITVLDYGLNASQKEKLLKQNVKILKCKRTGHVTVIRFRDIYQYVKNIKYKNIMMCDSGDIIFQTDISKLLSSSFKKIAATYDNTNILFQQYVSPIYFDFKLLPKMQKILMTKRMLNAGVLIGPKKKFEEMCKELYRMIKFKKNYGPDQIAINYLLYKDGFKLIDEKYNCVVLTSKIKWTIKDGKFYDVNNQLIPIIHNAGKSQIFRGIKDFGYGPNKNKLKKSHKLIVEPFKKIAEQLFWKNC